MSTTSNQMSSLIEALIKYRRLVFSVVFIFIAVGYFALGSMARQEDPSFPYRAGLVRIFYPGGTPSQIEKLITEPMEEELAQVAEIDKVISTSRDDIAIFNIELRDYVYDTDSAWDRVQDAISRAQLQFPNGVSRIEFDDRQIDMPAAVLSITGSDDPILLEEAALKLKSAIVGLDGVSRIEVEGAPAKEVIVRLDQDMVSRLGISRQFVADVIAQRNSIIPGGIVSSRDKNIRLNTQSDFDSLDELRQTMITLPSGQMVSLQSIAEVRLEPRLPLATQAFQDGKRAVALGIIAQRGQVDIVQFGKELRSRVDLVAPKLAPLKIEESFFQPDYVKDRLDGLRGNLIFSVSIIAIIVFFAMGWRTGALVSAVLPMVTMITLGLYSAGGGVFHQMAVIGMVISLGILIDNAIVVVEYIESALRKGVQLGQAIRESIQVMAKPLMASTGTTVAAFIPLLLAKGGVGDFTRAIPTMVVIAMIVSYLLSIFVLPLIAFYWLKPEEKSKRVAFEITDKIAEKSADLVAQGPKRVLFFVLVLLSVSAAMAPFLKQEFFPSTDRAQIVLDLELPNNTPLALTSKISSEIELELLAHKGVDSIYRHVGGSGFRFYYNMGGTPNESHIARFTINTTGEAQNIPLVDWVRDELKPRYPDAILIPKLLGQGPPRPAPIEIRVKHADPAVLYSASQAVRALLLKTPGVTELRSNLDLGTPELKLSIQDTAALNYGLQPNQVAAAIFAESRGLSAGQFRYDTDPVPIRVRSSQGQRSNIEVVQNQSIYNRNQTGVPLNQLASIQPAWTPTSIRHHNFERTVTVLSQIAPGFAFNQILDDFKTNLPSANIPADVTIEYGGDASASSQSNSNIAAAAPLALGLLIFFMMFQFNSFRRIGIVFVSIPLAAVGVIPGLAFSGEPFGFQSLLGVIALVGIVVNNAIVLIDVVDQSLNEGADINQAVRQALQKRTAPILLTTATTILGLMPLALSSSTLWPPMAWAIISGLMLSTMLTLVAIPALCTLLLGRKQFETAPIRVTPGLASVITTTLILVLLPVSQEVEAQENTFLVSKQSIIEQVKNNAQVSSLYSSAQGSEFEYQATKREAWAPKITLGGNYSQRDEASTIGLPQPFGTISVADDSAHVIEAKLTQPIFNLSKQRYATESSKLQSDGAKLLADAALHSNTGLALAQYYQLLSLREVRVSLEQLKTSLSARLDRINKQVNVGRALKTDSLQVRVAVNRVSQQLVENDSVFTSQSMILKSLLGLPMATNLSLSEADQLPSFTGGLDPNLSCLERLDCKAIELDVERTLVSQRSLKASFLPSVNLSIAETRSDGQLFVADDDRRAILEFSWPIFSGGQRLSRIKAAKEQNQSVQHRLTAFQQGIQTEISEARAQIKIAKSQLELAESSVQLDQERLRLSGKRYEEGLLNVDELLDAEASLAQSESDLARAKLGLLAAITLHSKATGAPY